MSKTELILVHGWATDSSVWEAGGLIQELAPETGFNIHNLNLPGHGGVKRWTEPTLRPAVDEVLTLASRQNAPVTAIGWSMGGQVLLSCAIAEPERFESLVLVGATPCFVNRGVNSGVNSGGSNLGQSENIVKRMLSDIKESPRETISRFCSLNFTEPERRTPGAAFFLKRFCTPPETLRMEDVATALESLLVTDLRVGLDSIKARTLVIHGALDSVCPVRAARYLADNIEGAELEIFELAGHAPFITEPKRFNRLVKDFIRRTSGGEGGGGP